MSPLVAPKLQLQVAWILLLGICASTLAYPVLSLLAFVDRFDPITPWYVQLLAGPSSPDDPRLLAPVLDGLDFEFLAAALVIGLGPRLAHWAIARRRAHFARERAQTLWSIRLAFVAAAAVPYIQACDELTHQVTAYIGFRDDYSLPEAVIYILMLLAAVASHRPSSNHPRETGLTD